MVAKNQRMRIGRDGCRRRSLLLHPKEGERTWLAFIEHDEIVLRQIADRCAFRIVNQHVHLDQSGRCVQRRRLILLSQRSCGRHRNGDGRSQHQCSDHLMLLLSGLGAHLTNVRTWTRTLPHSDFPGASVRGLGAAAVTTGLLARTTRKLALIDGVAASVAPNFALLVISTVVIALIPNSSGCSQAASISVR